MKLAIDSVDLLVVLIFNRLNILKPIAVGLLFRKKVLKVSYFSASVSLKVLERTIIIIALHRTERMSARSQLTHYRSKIEYLHNYTINIRTFPVRRDMRRAF